MSTPDLFRPMPAARRNDPATSHAAADSMRDIVSEQHGRILYALKAGGAGTIYDIAYRCIGLDHVAVARRMSELQASGKARTSGDTRPGPNGRLCRVWEAC